MCFYEKRVAGEFWVDALGLDTAYGVNFSHEWNFNQPSLDSFKITPYVSVTGRVSDSFLINAEISVPVKAISLEPEWKVAVSVFYFSGEGR